MNANCDGGAPATTPRSFNSGAYFAARSRANIAVCPPCECPHTTYSSLACASASSRAARTMSTVSLEELMPAM